MRKGTSCPDPTRNRYCRFTLIELLVVVAIISVLASLLLPALGKSRERVRIVACAAVLRSINIANSQYASDSNEFMVHGIDMGYAGWGQTAYSRRYYPTQIFDDDWGDAQPGTPGRNPDSDGAQNICGVGQLMEQNYLPSVPEAIACPSSDDIEHTGYELGMNTFSQVRAAVKANWRSEYYTGSSSYAYYGTTYTVRGPMWRSFDKDPVKTAMFAEHEQTNQTVRTLISHGSTPLPYWPRRHKAGINTAYNDGHVNLFKDPDRRITFWTNQTEFYGNAFALSGGAYDEK